MNGIATGMISQDQLREQVANGRIDPVVSEVCDAQGRLVGKRVNGDYGVEHRTHFCVYFLGTDLEMTTPEGFPGISLAAGSGDWLARPD